MATKTNKSRESISAKTWNRAYPKLSDLLTAGTAQQCTAKPSRMKGKSPA